MMRKTGTILIVFIVTALLTGAALLGYVSQHPSVIRECEIPEEYVAEIYAKSMGFYLSTL